MPSRAPHALPRKADTAPESPGDRVRKQAAEVVAKTEGDGRMAEPDFRIWTDGACRGNPGPGGWGYIVRASSGEESVQYDAERQTTNNRMELMAVIEALKSLP